MSLTRSHPSSWPRLVLLMVAAAMLVACGPSPSPSRTEPAGSQPQRAGGQNSITIAVSDTVEAMSIMGSSTTSGGWQSVNELHSQGLVTADRDIHRPVPRIAAEIPSFDAPAYSRAEWWKTKAGLITFQNEIMKYLYYRLIY